MGLLSLFPSIHAGGRLLSTSQPVVKERGAHESRVEYVTTVQGESGAVSQRTNSYVVLGTGLNRWDAAKQEWLPANSRIEFIKGFGVARGTQHRVILAPNARSAGGLVDVETPGANASVSGR